MLQFWGFLVVVLRPRSAATPPNYTMSASSAPAAPAPGDLVANLSPAQRAYAEALHPQLVGDAAAVVYTFTHHRAAVDKWGLVFDFDPDNATARQALRYPDAAWEAYNRERESCEKLGGERRELFKLELIRAGIAETEATRVAEGLYFRPYSDSVDGSWSATLFEAKGLQPGWLEFTHKRTWPPLLYQAGTSRMSCHDEFALEIVEAVGGGAGGPRTGPTGNTNWLGWARETQTGSTEIQFKRTQLPVLKCMWEKFTGWSSSGGGPVLPSISDDLARRILSFIIGRPFPVGVKNSAIKTLVNIGVLSGDRYAFETGGGIPSPVSKNDRVRPTMSTIGDRIDFGSKSIR